MLKDTPKEHPVAQPLKVTEQDHQGATMQISYIVTVNILLGSKVVMSRPSTTATALGLTVQ